MQQKKVIFFLVILFVISSAYLFYVSDQGRSLDQDKNWWVVYFTDPKGNNLDFVIENHSNQSNFHWEVSDDKKKKLNEGDVVIAKGSTWTSDVQVNEVAEKISVVIYAGDSKKEIYKYLSD